MTVDSSHDIFIFVLSLICGVLSGLIFDIFRAMRSVFKSGKSWVAIQDIVFCAIVFVMFSYVVNNCNNGSVRWYEIAGAVLGVMLYYSTISFALLKIFKFVLKIIKDIFEKIRRIFDKFEKFFIKKARCIKSAILNAFASFSGKFLKKSGEMKKN